MDKPNWTLTKPATKSERAELIKFFVDNLKNKANKPFPAKMIAVKLGHIKNIQDLYFMKSVFVGMQRTKGQESVQKWFWWSIKSQK